MHVDMDAFFASVEQLDNPAIRGKPVIVGADPKSGRGVVSAASYEARKFGVHSAQPITQAFKACPLGIFLPPRFDRYKELSDIVFKILEGVSPLVEPISIDEAFVDLTGTERLLGEPVAIGRRIKNAIREKTGLVASVGIAPNKFLAKIASDYGKPDGFVVIVEGKIREFLDPLPIRALWGVGPKTEQNLLQLGITTVGELARFPEDVLEKSFGESGKHLHELAHGIDDRAVNDNWERRGISKEHTYDRDENDKEKNIATVRHIADRLSARMRKKGISGRTITVKIRYSDFSTITRAKTLPRQVANSEEIFREASTLIIPHLTGAIRLLGIRISNLTGEEGEQLALLSGDDGLIPARNNKKISKLEEALDKIHEKFGDDSISRGTEVK
jgi:DNA polymerase-4